MDNGTFKRERRNSRAEDYSGEGRTGDEETDGQQSSKAQIGSGNDFRGAHVSVGPSFESKVDSHANKYFGVFNGKRVKRSPEVEAIVDGNGITDFGYNLIQCLSEESYIERKIIHDIVDIRHGGSINLLLDRCIRRAQENNIKRVVISKHYDGPQPHLHVVHDCKWTNRECRCFNVPVRPRDNAIHSADEWSEEDWLKLIKYLCQNGRWLSYCKSSNKEWIESDGCKGTTGEKFYGRCLDLSDECDSGSPEARPLEIRDHKYFSCSSRERLAIPANPYMGSTSGIVHYGTSTKGNKRTRATAEDIEAFLKKHITTPPENITKIMAWKTDPKFKYILTKDDAFKRGIHAFKNMILGATYQELMNMYEHADSVLFKAETISQYNEMYHTPDASFDICLRLLEYQVKEIAEQEMVEVNDVICEFIEDLYYILERKHPDRKKNTFEIIGPPQSWKSWFTKQIANFYISVGDIGNCTKGERFPFQDAVGVRINIMNDKDVHPDSLRQFLGPIGGDEDKVSQKGVSGEELTRIPVIHTNNKKIFYTHESLREPFRKRIIHYTFKCVENEYFERVGKKICNPLVWPKLINFAKSHGYIKNE